MCKQGRSQHRATAAKINDCRNKNLKLYFGFSDPLFNSCLSLTTLYSVRVANLVSENKSAYTFSLFKENVYSNGIICYSPCVFNEYKLKNKNSSSIFKLFGWGSA